MGIFVEQDPKKKPERVRSRTQLLLVVSLFIPYVEFWDKEEEVDSGIETLRKYLLERTMLSVKIITVRVQSYACGPDRSQQLLMER